MDDIFLHELCLKLGKTRRQIGEQMDAHELSVLWPAYFAYVERERKRAAQAEDLARTRKFQG